MENTGQGKNNPCFKVDQHSVLNGLNHDVSAVKGTFSYSFSSIAPLQKVPITASSENDHVSHSSVYRLKHCYLFQTKLFKEAGVSCACKHLR